MHSAHTCQAKPQASETRKNYGAAMKAHTEMPKKRVLRKEVSSTEVTEGQWNLGDRAAGLALTGHAYIGIGAKHREAPSHQLP